MNLLGNSLKSGEIPFPSISWWWGVTYFPTVRITPEPSLSSNTDCMRPCSRKQFCSWDFINKATSLYTEIILTFPNVLRPTRIALQLSCNAAATWMINITSKNYNYSTLYNSISKMVVMSVPTTKSRLLPSHLFGLIHILYRVTSNPLIMPLKWKHIRHLTLLKLHSRIRKYTQSMNVLTLLFQLTISLALAVCSFTRTCHIKMKH